MSAFMVCDRHIDALLTAGLEMVGRHGPLRWFAPAEKVEGTHQRGEPWGPAAVEVYEQRHRELTRETAGQVGAMLLAENAASVNHRYNEDEPEQPYVYRRFPRELPTVHVLSAIACLEYQSCEHEEWEQSEAHDFCRALHMAMIRRIPGYDEAPWEIREDPPAPPPAPEPVRPYRGVAESIVIIRKGLRARCKTLSVRRGRGTASCWIEIFGSGEYGNFTDAERAALDAVGLKAGGNFCVISPDDQAYWVEKLS